MDREELMEYVKEMFDGDEAPKPDTLGALQFAMKDGADLTVTQDELRLACDELCWEGVLQRFDVDTYGLSVAYCLERERADVGFFAGAVAEHELKRIGKK